MTQLIIKTIEFIPDNININVILDMFKKKFNYTCNQEYGYIIDVISVEKIIDSVISIYNGNVILTCEILIENLLPIVNSKIKGIVKKIFPQGFFIMVRNCMKIFVPNEGEKNIKIDSEVEVEIIQIRFLKGKYDCIGKLVY